LKRREFWELIIIRSRRGRGRRMEEFGAREKHCMWNLNLSDVFVAVKERLGMCRPSNLWRC
jgi:hypothetical protein